jgi:hypothetical protein
MDGELDQGLAGLDADIDRIPGLHRVNQPRQGR